MVKVRAKLLAGAYKSNTEVKFRQKSKGPSGPEAAASSTAALPDSLRQHKAGC